MARSYYRESFAETVSSFVLTILGIFNGFATLGAFGFLAVMLLGIFASAESGSAGVAAIGGVFTVVTAASVLTGVAYLWFGWCILALFLQSVRLTGRQNQLLSDLRRHTMNSFDQLEEINASTLASYQIAQHKEVC